MSRADLATAEILQCQVFARGCSRPFAELTPADASAAIPADAPPDSR